MECELKSANDFVFKSSNFTWLWVQDVFICKQTMCFLRDKRMLWSSCCSLLIYLRQSSPFCKTRSTVSDPLPASVIVEIKWWIFVQCSASYLYKGSVRQGCTAGTAGAASLTDGIWELINFGTTQTFAVAAFFFFFFFFLFISYILIQNTDQLFECC